MSREFVDGLTGGLREKRAEEIGVEHLRGGFGLLVGEDGDGTGVGGFAVSNELREDLGGRDVEDAGRELNIGLRFARVDAGGRMRREIVNAKASDGADDEGVEIGEAADFGSEGVGIETGSIGFSLFFQDFIEGIAVENPIPATGEELGDELRGDTFANLAGIGANDV